MSAATDEGVETVEDADYTGSAPLVKVGEGFFDSPGALDKPGQARTKTPWIGLFSTKTNAGKDNLLAAGVEVNQFYVHDAAGPLKVKPFRYFLLKANRYYTKLDKAGKTVEAGYTDPQNGQRNSPFKETLVALVLVVSQDTMGKTVLIPATWVARSGLCKALSRAIELAGPNGAAVDKNAWASRSAAHAIASNARFPGGRFITTAWASLETTQDGANDFNLGHSSIGVPTPEQVQAFNAITEGTPFIERVVPATQSWAYRCQQIEKLIPQNKS